MAGKEVIKTINGCQYRYWQVSYRDKFTGKVITKSHYLGPVVHKKKQLGDAGQFVAMVLTLMLSKKARHVPEPKLFIAYAKLLEQRALYNQWYDKRVREVLDFRHGNGPLFQPVTYKEEKPATLEELALREEFAAWSEKLQASTVAVNGGRIPVAPQPSDAPPLDLEDEPLPEQPEIEAPADDEAEPASEPEPDADQSPDVSEGSESDATPDCP